MTNIAGFGLFAKEFLGFGAIINCQHCHNKVIETVYVDFNYEDILFVRKKGFGGYWSSFELGHGYISFMCPICEKISERFQGKESLA